MNHVCVFSKDVRLSRPIINFSFCNPTVKEILWVGGGFLVIVAIDVETPEGANFLENSRNLTN